MPTYAENQAARDANSDYQASGSRAKALAYISAVEGLLGQVPAKSVKGERGEEEVEFDMKVSYERAIERAQAWLVANPAAAAASRTKYVDFSNFRG